MEFQSAAHISKGLLMPWISLGHSTDLPTPPPPPKKKKKKAHKQDMRSIRESFKKSEYEVLTFKSTSAGEEEKVFTD